MVYIGVVRRAAEAARVRRDRYGSTRLVSNPVDDVVRARVKARATALLLAEAGPRQGQGGNSGEGEVGRHAGSIEQAWRSVAQHAPGAAPRQPRDLSGCRELRGSVKSQLVGARSRRWPDHQASALIPDGHQAEIWVSCKSQRAYASADWTNRSSKSGAKAVRPKRPRPRKPSALR